MGDETDKDDLGGPMKPTNADTTTPRVELEHPHRRRRLAWFLMAALASLVLIVGCGGDDDSAPTSTGSEEVASETRETSEPAATPVDEAEEPDDSADDSSTADDATEEPGDAPARGRDGPAMVFGDQWANRVSASWDEFQMAFVDAAITYVENDFARESESDQVAAAIELFESLAPALIMLADDLPPLPAEPLLAAPYEDFLAATDHAATVATEALDVLTSREDDFVDDIDANGIGGSDYEAVRIAFDDADRALTAACFALQAAMAEGGLTVPACTPDGQEPADEPCEVDPSTEATEGQQCLLEPGIHTISILGPRLTLDLDEPTRIITDTGLVDLQDDSAINDFQIFAIDGVADPAALDPDRASVTIDVPMDLAALTDWASALPVTVEETGTSSILGGDTPWVRMSLDVAAAQAAGLGEPPVVPSTSVYGDVRILPEVPLTLWIVPVDDTTALAVIHYGFDPRADGAGYVESMLADATVETSG